MGALVKRRLNQAGTLLEQEYEGGHFLYRFWCPACKDMHLYNVGRKDGPTWSYDGNFECPTFKPSLRYLSGCRCHLFLTAGVIEYCGDCPHAMAGQKASLQPIPEEYREHGF